MAPRTVYLDKNAPGRFSVSSECAGCGVCLETAPRNFMSDDVEGHSYVASQPVDASEESQCREAMELCPAGAIADDGFELQPVICAERDLQNAAVQ